MNGHHDDYKTIKEICANLINQTDDLWVLLLVKEILEEECNRQSSRQNND